MTKKWNVYQHQNKSERRCVDLCQLLRFKQTLCIAYTLRKLILFSFHRETFECVINGENILDAVLNDIQLLSFCLSEGFYMNHILEDGAYLLAN